MSGRHGLSSLRKPFKHAGSTARHRASVIWGKFCPLNDEAPAQRRSLAPELEHKSRAPEMRDLRRCAPCLLGRDICSDMFGHDA